MVELTVQQSNNVLEPLVQEFRTQLCAEKQLRTEQGGKLWEFRTSLVDYQQVLKTLRQNVAQQEQQVAALQQNLNRLVHQRNTRHQQVQTAVKDVRQHLQTEIGTLEQISKTFSGRLEAYEQQRSRTSQQTSTGEAMRTQLSSRSPLFFHPSELFQSPVTQNVRSSSDRSQEISPSKNRASGEEISGSAVAYASPSLSPLTPSFPVQSASPIPENTEAERVAYHNAFNLLRVKNYRVAAKGFSAFLRTFPDSLLAANSQYELGECYYGQRCFQEANLDVSSPFTLRATKFQPSSLKSGIPILSNSILPWLVPSFNNSSVPTRKAKRRSKPTAASKKSAPSSIILLDL